VACYLDHRHRCVRVFQVGDCLGPARFGPAGTGRKRLNRKVRGSSPRAGSSPTGSGRPAAALRVPDHELALLSEQFRSAVADPGATLLGRIDGLTFVERAALLGEFAHFTDLCQRLAVLDIPETLQLDDLYAGKMFVRAGRHRVLRLWGRLHSHVRARARRSEVIRLRDAYRALDGHRLARRSDRGADIAVVPE